MYEAIEWLWSHRTEPVSVMLTGLFVLLLGKLLDALARLFVSHQVRRMLHIPDDFQTYVANQARIEKKLDLLLTERGLQWLADSNGTNHIPIKNSFVSYWRMKFTAHVADKFTFWRSKMQIQVSKVWLSGIIAAIIGNIALRYGFKFDVAWADMIAEIIIQYVLPGIVAFLNRTKEVKPSGTTIQPEDNR